METDDIQVPVITDSKKDSIDIRPISGWMDEWIHSIQEDENRISLMFPLLDHEMRGKLRGKLCVIIHYGGTKKSLLAQNIVHYNIFENNHRVIYSSMEMGVAELASRFINILVDANPDQASEFLESKQKSDPSFVRKIVNENVGNAYGDRLLITPNSGLIGEDYKALIEKVRNENGAVDILVVDGLSMMGGVGTDTDLANKHTRNLKEIAKDENILVLLIVHASRGGEKHFRDVAKYARGSEKIIDNCDFYICPSLIVSDDFDGNKEYDKGRGYIRLVNKRGSGNTVNLIYKFDNKRLIMSQSNEDPLTVDKDVARVLSGF
jgi:replicative DNA helicase